MMFAHRINFELDKQVATVFALSFRVWQAQLLSLRFRNAISLAKTLFLFQT